MVGVGGISRERPEPRKGLRASRLSRAEAEAHARFKQEVLAFPCWLSERDPDHVCSGRKQAHHLLPARLIRREFEGTASDAELARLAYAPCIGAPLCRKAHDQVEKRQVVIYWEDLTDECIEHARALGMEADLLRECPPRGEGT